MKDYVANNCRIMIGDDNRPKIIFVGDLHTSPVPLEFVSELVDQLRAMGVEVEFIAEAYDKPKFDADLVNHNAQQIKSVKPKESLQVLFNTAFDQNGIGVRNMNYDYWSSYINENVYDILNNIVTQIEAVISSTSPKIHASSQVDNLYETDSINKIINDLVGVVNCYSVNKTESFSLNNTNLDNTGNGILRLFITLINSLSEPMLTNLLLQFNSEQAGSFNEKIEALRNILSNKMKDQRAEVISFINQEAEKTGKSIGVFWNTIYPNWWIIHLFLNNREIGNTLDVDYLFGRFIKYFSDSDDEVTRLNYIKCYFRPFIGKVLEKLDDLKDEEKYLLRLDEAGDNFARIKMRSELLLNTWGLLKPLVDLILRFEAFVKTQKIPHTPHIPYSEVLTKLTQMEGCKVRGTETDESYISRASLDDTILGILYNFRHECSQESGSADNEAAGAASSGAATEKKKKVCIVFGGRFHTANVYDSLLKPNFSPPLDVQIRVLVKILSEFQNKEGDRYVDIIEALNKYLSATVAEKEANTPPYVKQSGIGGIMSQLADGDRAKLSKMLEDYFVPFSSPDSVIRVDDIKHFIPNLASPIHEVSAESSVRKLVQKEDRWYFISTYGLRYTPLNGQVIIKQPSSTPEGIVMQRFAITSSPKAGPRSIERNITSQAVYHMVKTMQEKLVGGDYKVGGFSSVKMLENTDGKFAFLYIKLQISFEDPDPMKLPVHYATIDEKAFQFIKEFLPNSADMKEPLCLESVNQHRFLSDKKIGHSKNVVEYRMMIPADQVQRLNMTHSHITGQERARMNWQRVANHIRGFGRILEHAHMGEAIISNMLVGDEGYVLSQASQQGESRSFI